MTFAVEWACGEDAADRGQQRRIRPGRTAMQLAQRLSAERVPVIEFRANTQNLSEPTKELDAAMRAQRLAHGGNPVLE